MAVLGRILIAATLVVHLMVGCCSHHAHGCDGKDCPLPAHGDVTPDGQCPEGGDDHSHHGQHDCQGAKCFFVSPSRTVNDSSIQPFQASVAVLLNELPSLVNLNTEQYSLASGRLLLPVRLHLANQVLLI